MQPAIGGSPLSLRRSWPAMRGVSSERSGRSAIRLAGGAGTSGIATSGAACGMLTVQKHAHGAEESFGDTGNGGDCPWSGQQEQGGAMVTPPQQSTD